MVECSGLESPCRNPQETAENAAICAELGAPDTLFTFGSADGDGTYVGTRFRTLILEDWFWHYERPGLAMFDPARFTAFLEAAGYADGRPGVCPLLPDWAVEETEAEHKAWRRRGVPGHLTYFARAKYTGRIKIGKTTQPAQNRVNQLQHEKPYGEACELLCTRRGEHFERLYHQIFETWRVGGEWFAPHPDILAEIARLTPGP